MLADKTKKIAGKREKGQIEHLPKEMSHFEMKHRRANAPKTTKLLAIT